MTLWLSSGLVNHLWQSTLFVAAVWLVTLALRSKRPRLRYWLWVAASVKFLVPVSWLVSIGRQFQWRTAPSVAQPAATFVLEEMFVAPAFSGSAVAALGPPSDVFSWVLVLIWIVGMVAVLASWWRQWATIREALRRASPLRVNATQRQLRFAVMSSSSAFEPGVIGIRRPVLLLPDGLVSRLTPVQMNALIIHEQCHIRCHDNLFAMIHMGVEALFWFHPVVWWIERRLINERERACDEAVLRSTSDACEYAETILQVCRHSVGMPFICAAGISGSDLRRRVESILRREIGRPLGLAGVVSLFVCAAVAVLGPVLVGAVGVSAHQDGQSSGLSTASENNPQSGASFEVASVRRNMSAASGAGLDMSRGQLRATNATVQMIIRQAFDVMDSNVVGAPAWVTSERYDVIAKAPEGVVSAEAMRPLMRALLADRFNLTTHTEKREMPVFALVQTSSDGTLGPGLRRAAFDCANAEAAAVAAARTESPDDWPMCSVSFNPGLLYVGGYRLVEVLRLLSPLVGRSIIDETGIRDAVQIRLQYRPQGGAGQPQPGAATDDRPDLFTALQEQAALKLETRRAPIDVLVIDRIERPSED